MSEFTKWVATWGNATSIIDQVAPRFGKDLTLRYPVLMCFDGSKIRIRFSNITGKEVIKFNAYVAKSVSSKEIDEATTKELTLNGDNLISINPGEEVTSDEIDFAVKRGEKISVSVYLPDYTDMNSGVLITGPLSEGFYSYGNFATSKELPLDLTRKTNWFYFLNTIDVLTDEKNHAIVCYGDSITAQSWPDYLIKRCFDEGYENVSIIRRAVSGTRILRQYDNITYAAYGIKGETRFPVEINTSGVSDVIIQHGINDIIHPVGEDVNPFRPWSDMPTCEDLINGVKNYYLKLAREMNLNVYSGTLLPIYGWRTYADFRDDLRKEFNLYLSQSDDFDGCVDFDLAVADKEDPRKFKEGFDSGDHLHPSEAAYKAMADAVPLDLMN